MSSIHSKATAFKAAMAKRHAKEALKTARTVERHAKEQETEKIETAMLHYSTAEEQAAAWDAMEIAAESTATRHQKQGDLYAARIDADQCAQRAREPSWVPRLDRGGEED